MISVKPGDITCEVCDAIVNPSNSYGWMGGGVAFAIKFKGGKIIEDEAVSKAPIPIGCAVLTSSGSLPCRFVVHASTMKEPAETASAENVRRAVNAALSLAFENGIKTIAFPGMGTGVGELNKDIAAGVMVEEIKKFDKKFDKITLIAHDSAIYSAFMKRLKLI